MQLSTDHTVDTPTSPSCQESTLCKSKQERMDLEASTQTKQEETTVDPATTIEDMNVKTPTTTSTKIIDPVDKASDNTDKIAHTVRTIVPKIAPRPDNMALEFNKTTIAPVKSKPINNETTTGTTNNNENNLDNLELDLNMALSQHLPPLPSSFLPGIDDNMTGILLPSTKQTLPTTTETTTTTNPSMLPIDINNFQLSSLPNLAPFQFTQASGQQTALVDLGETANIDLSDPSKSDLLQNMINTYSSYEEFALAHPHLAAEFLRREILNQKVRADNRERKKRWREQNEERNKDNDLRCRVNKRANKLFGKEESEHKQRWAKEEFAKRQFRRKDKERRRNVVDDVVSSASSPTTAFSPHLLPSTPSSGHLPLLQDAYVSMLFNNLGSLPPAVALKLVEGIKLMETTIKNAGDDQDQALPQQLAEFLHQLQAASSSPSPSVSSSPPSPPTMEERASSRAASPLTASPPTDDNLSALLIQTLQQSAPLEPATPSSPAPTEYTDPPVRLYPMEAIMTLMKVNAEWARQ